MRKDITGQKFGKLTAIKYVGMDKHYKQIYTWLCECGNTKDIIMESVTSGNTKSCGCIMEEKIKNKKSEYIKTPNTKCSLCGKEFYASPSRKTRQKLIFCSVDCKYKYYRKFPLANPNAKHFTSESKFFGAKFTRWKMQARRRKIPFDETMTYETLLELWKKQEGKCYYTHVPMDISSTQGPTLVSIDRLDSTKGYSKDNIVLCCYAINTMKSNYPLEDVLKFIKQIVECK